MDIDAYTAFPEGTWPDRPEQEPGDFFLGLDEAGAAAFCDALEPDDPDPLPEYGDFWFEEEEEE